MAKIGGGRAARTASRRPEALAKPPFGGMLRGLTIPRLSARLLAASLAAWLPSTASEGSVDFNAARWRLGEGADSRLRAVVVVDAAWSWHDADAFASSLGGELARAASPAELSFLVLLSDFPGAFDCAGPWLGGYRQPQGAWLWNDGTVVAAFGWRPLRPAQSIVFESALLLSGIDGPDGAWIDVFPEIDSGVGTRSCLVSWDTFPDCNGNDLPDALEIARNPRLDGNGDGVPDGCTPPNPADLNGDGVVNALDLSIVLNAWGSSDRQADVDGDGRVGATDLAAVLSGWNGP